MPASVTNCTGQREPATGGLTAFAQTPTMRAGANMGIEPTFRASPTFIAKNRVHQGVAGAWQAYSGSGIVTLGPDNATASTWTDASSTIIYYTCYGPNQANALDSMGNSAYAGDFTLVYDDANVGTSTAAACWLATVPSISNAVSTPRATSGDGSGSLVGSGGGVQIPTGNITVASGAITAISFSGMTFATTYTGAAIYIATPNGGSGFAGTVVVSGGSPSSVNIVCGGSSYPSGASGMVAYVYGTVLSGTTITSVVNFEPASSPTSWDPSVAIYLAQSQGQYTLGTPWVIPPVMPAGTAATNLSRTNPMALDDNVLSALTGAGGRTIGIMRFVDRTQGPGGISNMALPSDLPPPGTNQQWSTWAQRTSTAYFSVGRYLNTNPANGPTSSGGNGTYNWTPTQKVYSPQPWATNFDDPLTPTAATTSGSPVVANLSSFSGLMVGAAVSSSADPSPIPSGSYIAYLGALVTGRSTSGSTSVVGVSSIADVAAGMPISSGNFPAGTTVSSTSTSTSGGITTYTITMSAEATATGFSSIIVGDDRQFTLGSPSGALANATATSGSVELSIQNPGYATLPASDDGYFIDNNFGSYQHFTMELVSTRPHGLVSGQYGGIFGDKTIPMTNIALSSADNLVSTAVSGSVTVGSATVSDIASTALFTVGEIVAGPGVPSGTTITAIGTSTLTLSNSISGSFTGTLTSGQATVTNIPSTALVWAGASISGTGIPSGTTIQTVNSSSEVTLSANATASGSQSLSVTGTDSGATVYVNGLWPGLHGTATWYVTGPTTLAVTFSAANYTETTPAPGGAQLVGTNAQINLETSDYPNGWVATVTVPNNDDLEPYDATAAYANQLGNSAIQVNFPYAASDSMVQAIAQRIIGQIGPNNDIYLQFSNENWNNASGYVAGAWLGGVSTLLGPEYATSGTIMGYVKAPYAGTLEGFGPADATMGAHMYDVFATEWTGAGNAATRLHRIEGSQYANPSVTLSVLDQCQQFGAAPDVVAVGAYLDMPSYFPFTAACSAAGAVVQPAGMWPIEAVNDFIRHWACYSTTQQGYWAGHGTYCANYGQPLHGATVSTTSSPAGSIPAGSYSLYYTWVDSEGRETTVGLSYAAVTVSSGQSILLQQVGWPSWAAKLRVYLSPSGAAQGVAPTSYAEFLGSTYYGSGGGDQVPIGSNLTISSFPNSGSPPTTNNAAPNVKIPAMMCYEGALESVITGTVPLQFYVNHDMFAHPSARDLWYGWFCAVQQGYPPVSGSGATAANYYQLYSYDATPPSYHSWILSHGQEQMPGPGLSSQYATIAGGWPADAHDHNQANAQSPAFQGLVDFFSGSSEGAPTVTATTPATRATEVGVTAAISVVFSEDIDSTTLSLSLTPTASLGSPSYDTSNFTATWTPSGSGLATATTYTATVSADAAGSDVPMVEPYSWSFTTVTAPTVSSVSPAPNASGVAASTTISVTFSENIDPSTLSLSVTPTLSLSAASYDPGSLTATWSASGVAPSTSYTATVSADAAGTETPMAEPYSWSFVGAEPAPYVVSVSLYSALITFNEPITSGSLSVSLSNITTGAAVPVTTSEVSSSSYLMTISTPLSVADKYVMTISGATASDGTPMETTTVQIVPTAAKSGGTWFPGLGVPRIQP